MPRKHDITLLVTQSGWPQPGGSGLIAWALLYGATLIAEALHEIRDTLKGATADGEATHD